MAQNFNTFHFNSPPPSPLPQGEREFPDGNKLVFLHYALCALLYALFLGVLTTSSSMLQSNQFLAAHLEE